MPTRRKINHDAFVRDAHLGVDHLAKMFKIDPQSVYRYAGLHGVKVSSHTSNWRADGNYPGFDPAKESIRAFRDRTGLNDVAGRARDIVILRALRLRADGMKYRELGEALGLRGEELDSAFNQASLVKAEDIRRSGEPEGEVRKGYW